MAKQQATGPLVQGRAPKLSAVSAALEQAVTPERKRPLTPEQLKIARQGGIA